MKASPLLLCAVLVLTSGCESSRAYIRAKSEVSQSQAALTNEQTALIRQYRECLTRSEADPEVNCSGYRTAVEVFDARSD